jgi:hypothetical protein
VSDKDDLIEPVTDLEIDWATVSAVATLKAPVPLVSPNWNMELIAEAAARIAALEAKLAEKDALLRECGEALAEYACHGGPDLPCIRSEDQCRTECGKIAGDTLTKIVDATDAD